MFDTESAIDLVRLMQCSKKREQQKEARTLVVRSEGYCQVDFFCARKWVFGAMEESKRSRKWALPSILGAGCAILGSVSPCLRLNLSTPFGHFMVVEPASSAHTTCLCVLELCGGHISLAYTEESTSREVNLSAR